MSAITGLGSGQSSIYAALNQLLFKSIDQNGDGSVSQAELEQAVTANGGTSQGADQLYAALDPQATGSVDAQQFVTGLQSLLSSQTQGALIQAQSDPTGAAGATHGHGHGHHGGQKLAQLFQSIDSNGDGSIDQSEMEQAFSSQGLPTSEADQLFAALDPNGTGSINQQQFVSGMQALRSQAAAQAAPPVQQGNEIDISISITETGSGSTASGGSQDLAASLQQILSGLSGGAGSRAPTTDASAAAAPSSGAGGSSSGTTTSVTYNADGTVTTTVTNPDGTQTVTTTGTPNSAQSTTAGASSAGSTSGSTASGDVSLDKLLSDFFSVGRKLASGSLSSGTLGQLLTQQQTG